MAKPITTTDTMYVRSMPPDLKQRLRVQAANRGFPDLNKYVVDLLGRAVERDEREPDGEEMVNH